MSNDFKITSSYFPFLNNLACLTIQVNKPKETTIIEKIKKNVLIVLDVSGSMCGSGISQATEAISALITDLHTANLHITFITFNHFAQSIDFGNLSLQKQLEHVRSSRASGGTSFSAAFEEIEKVIKREKNQHFAIIFFTDGQDYSNIEPSLKSLSHCLEDTLASEVHTIGFTSDHDARLLDRITKAGKIQGTFQYVKQSSEIKQAISSITSLLTRENIAATLIVGEGEEEQKVVLKMDEENLFIAKNFVPLKEKTLPKMVLKLKFKKKDMNFELEPSLQSEVSGDDIIKASISFITSKLLKLSTIITSPTTTKEELESIKGELDELDKKLDEIPPIIFKTRDRMKKKELFPLVLEAKELMAKFYELLSSAMAKTLTNDKIASINDLAYRGITKRSLKTKLDKRVGNNVQLFEELEKKVENAVKKIDFDELRKKYDPKEIGTCALSCLDFIEALEDKDCMCISLDVVRSQAAIADPTQVVIKKINQTFMTAESFLDSVTYALSANSMAHGGFSKQSSGHIVSGMARETITGVLPLFISPEHWSVAKHKMKPILGWMTTLDVLGYSYAQVKTIPFLVLAKAAIDRCESEFKQKQYQLILDTCIQIYKDASHEDFERRLSDEVTKLFNDYVTKPEVRTIDIIPNNEVFLAQVLCAIKVGDIKLMKRDELDTFFACIIEEELRRRQSYKFRDLTPEETTQRLIAILGVDLDVYVKPHVEAFREEQRRLEEEAESKKGESHFELKFKNILKTKNPDLVIEEKPKDKKDAPVTKKEVEKKQNIPQPEEYDGKIIEYTMAAKKLVDESEGTFNKYCAQWKNIFTLFLTEEDAKKEIDTKLLFTKMETKEKMLCMCIQNMLHAKNADRRQAIVDKTYVNPFVQKAAETFLRNQFIQLVKSQCQKGINDVIAEFEAKKSHAVSSIFAKTTNIYEAAGTLLGVYQGRDFHYFYKCLQESVCPLAIEKLKILLTGEYMGVPLICDKIKTKKNIGDAVMWSPSRQNVYRFWKRNRELLSKEEWIELFGMKWKEYFEKRYNLDKPIEK